MSSPCSEIAHRGDSVGGAVASDEMLEPGWLVRFADIERYRNKSDVAICWFMYGSNVHPVPEFYK